MLLQSIELSI